MTILAKKLDDWQQVKLGEIATKIGSGATPRGGSRSYQDSGISLIRSLNVFDFQFEYESLAFINEEQAEQLSNVVVQPQDILLNITGASVARCCMVPNDVLPARVNQHVSIVRINKAMAVPKYVLYCINSPRYKTELLTIAQGGATREALTRQKISDFEIPLPPFPLQRKIAVILSAYDDIIGNNTRRIRILEEMARTLYREWFIKFRFPGHEKARFVDSPLGRIPEGWEVATLGDHISVDKGLSYKGKFLTPEGAPMVNLKCINAGGGFKREGTKPYSGDYKPRHTIKPGDIVLANTDLTQAGNVIGSPALVPKIEDENDIIISHHLYAIRFDEETPLARYFLYHLLLTHDFKEFAKGRASGTTVLGLRPDGVLGFRFTCPPGELIQTFENIAKDMYQLTESLEDKNQTLRQARDLLLQRLISGELDVSELDITTEGL